MGVLINIAEMWVLITRAGAIAMALLLLLGVWRAIRDVDEAPDHLRSYGDPRALRPVLYSVLMSCLVLLIWPPLLFVLGGAMADLSLRAQRQRGSRRLVELPTEGVLTLSVWRLFGWTSLGLAPVSLPAWASLEMPELSLLVGFTTMLGAWAALRGGPTLYPHVAELAWHALRPEDEAPAVEAPRRKVVDKPQWSEDEVQVATRPVGDEGDAHAAARAAAQQLASAAIAAQLRAIQRAAPVVVELEEAGPEGGAPAADVGADERAPALQSGEAGAGGEAPVAESGSAEAGGEAPVAESGEAGAGGEAPVAESGEAAAALMTESGDAGAGAGAPAEESGAGSGLGASEASDGESAEGVGEVSSAVGDASSAAAEGGSEVAVAEDRTGSADAPVPTAVVQVEPTVVVDLSTLPAELRPIEPTRPAARSPRPAWRSPSELPDPMDAPAPNAAVAEESDEDDKTVDTSWS